MDYKGFTARVEFDQEAGVLFGDVEGLRDIITFEATDVRGIEASFRASVDDYLEQCAVEGVEAERPYSGKFLLRLDTSLHREVAHAAARSGRSLNAFAAEIFRTWIAQDRTFRSGASATKLLGSEASARAGSNLTLYNVNLPAPEPLPTIVAQKAPAWRSVTKDTPGALTPNTPAGSKTPSRALLAHAR